MSARARIVGWMLVVVGLALSVSVFATWTILLATLENRVNAELANEMEKLRKYAESSSASPRAMLEDYMAVNAPDRHETFFVIVDGKARWVTYADPPAVLDTDEALVARMAAATEPEQDWATSTAGRVRWAVMPVIADGEIEGSFVAIVFYDLERQEIVEAVRVLGLTALAALLLAGAAGWFVAGRVLAPVRLVRQTAERIGGSGDLSRRLAVSGDDDVSALAATFNHMLDRLERAFAVQRDFLDDAGHELRTPITVVRGHLELMGDDPGERAATLALVTDELGRMNRLVDDLIMLARSEQPGFVTPGEVELADLTVEVVAKARALGERRWRVDEVAEEQVTADRQRLTQALIQLVANAVRHTGPGDLIAVGSAVREGQVELWVRDTGPGVPEQDRERIFNRFVRGAARTGSHDGAGLGLAIVRSIAEAHRGIVRVREANGGGALFLISFPYEEIPLTSPYED
ncbi:HAMP domain-containing histidine kinase [Streptosporangium sp. NBC_01495]|uniref:sensor histidine kinase n=1 Tax=Streptosporangium sp. NBC_01495 TaxID=2903899 RepID=UPI002E320225|nr:HAMP domain-containing sensor histidine kinase [Streptosporangium sp. NBC_01495]